MTEIALAALVAVLTVAAAALALSAWHNRNRAERAERVLRERREDLRRGREPGRPTAKPAEEVTVEMRMLRQLVRQLMELHAAAPGATVAGRIVEGRRLDVPEMLQEERPLLLADPERDADVFDLVRRAVKEDRIDVTMQPIVSLPQRKTRHYEAFTRIRLPGDDMLMPDRFAHIAARAGLTGALDNVLLLRSVQIVRESLRRNAAQGVFAAVSIHSLRDAEFIDQFAEFMRDNIELLPRLTFGFAMDDFREVVTDDAGPIDRLRQLGCRFALDRCHDLALLDADALQRHNIRFLKVDVQRLIDEASGRSMRLDPLLLKRELDRAAIDIIVTGLDSETQLREILDFPMDFGQGLLFGAADLPARADLVGR